MDNMLPIGGVVVQVYPLAMVAYRIGIILMIKCLKSKYPDITHPWYAENAEALGTFDNLEQYFKALKCNGLAWGYYPNPTKRILAVHPQNLEAGELFGRRHGFKV